MWPLAATLLFVLDPRCMKTPDEKLKYPGISAMCSQRQESAGGSKSKPPLCLESQFIAAKDGNSMRKIKGQPLPLAFGC
eukprot:scaffold2855_cov23-Cyclotella_meneghiniana.AAC.1